MKNSIQIRSGVARCAPRGDFDALSREPFLDSVEELLTHGINRLIVNMRRVRFLSSSGLSALIKARHQLRDAGGELVVSQASNDVLGTLAVLGLQDILVQRSSDDSAELSLR